ncbi:MAG: hypothetical protein AVDCRST_MAG23-749, partial [uncultured Sphingosinicella sp.]
AVFDRVDGSLVPGRMRRFVGQCRREHEGASRNGIGDHGGAAAAGRARQGGSGGADRPIRQLQLGPGRAAERHRRVGGRAPQEQFPLRSHHFGAPAQERRRPRDGDLQDRMRFRCDLSGHASQRQRAVPALDRAAGPRL